MKNQTIIFCSKQSEVEYHTGEYLSSGAKVSVISAKDKPEIREAQLKSFNQGESDVLIMLHSMYNGMRIKTTEDTIIHFSGPVAQNKRITIKTRLENQRIFFERAEHKIILQEELEKCKNSPYYFFMNYCTINGKPAKTSLNEEEFNKLWGAAASHTKLPENKSRSKNDEKDMDNSEFPEMVLVFFGTIHFPKEGEAVVEHLSFHDYLFDYSAESEAEQIAEKDKVDYVIPSKFKGEIIFQNL